MDICQLSIIVYKHDIYAPTYRYPIVNSILMLIKDKMSWMVVEFNEDEPVTIEPVPTTWVEKRKTGLHAYWPDDGGSLKAKRCLAPPRGSKLYYPCILKGKACKLNLWLYNIYIYIVLSPHFRFVLTMLA